MRILAALGMLAFFLSDQQTAVAQQWTDLHGQIVWKGKAPGQKPLDFGTNKDAAECKKDKEALEEDYIVNPSNGGLKNVFVWIRPAGGAKNAAFPLNLIHPDLKKPDKDPVEIDQPCCRFIPHVLAARAGQTLIIKNSAKIGHNANFASDNNGNFNKLIQPNDKHVLTNPLVAEPGPILVACNLHPWMKARIRVFDHPYFAITDADGKFTIKKAPTGAFDIFYWHPDNGWIGGKDGRNGYPININNGVMDLGKKLMEKN